MAQRKIIIIGGGIVGLVTAIKVAARFPGAQLSVLEKEHEPGRHQTKTSHNSGVLHCGLYYKPGSAKARLAVEGIRKMVAFCQEHGIAHEICGKLVVATDAAEVTRLRELQQRGAKNGLAGLQWLDHGVMREIEPHVGGLAALRVPQEGIADYPKVVAARVQRIRANGGRVFTNAGGTSLTRDGAGWRAETPAGDLCGDFIINCAGLHCDRVSELAGEKRAVRIVPFRGEYYQLKAARQHLVRHLIYLVPDPQFSFLGAHFARLIHGGIAAGPNAVLAFAREGYTKTDLNVADLWDALSFVGLWRFIGRHQRMTREEITRSFSRKLFCRSRQKLVPEIREDDLESGGAGVRAQAMSPAGEWVRDFHFARGPRALHVLNAPSPAATALLAIGVEITRLVAAEQP